jgi:hypothetical protein
MFLDQIDVISFTRALTSLSVIDSQSPLSASMLFHDKMEEIQQVHTSS